MEEVAVTEYKFDGQKVATKGIIEKLPEGLALFLWDIIEAKKRDNAFTMDYLQIFELSVLEGKVQVVTHKQECPEPYEAVYYPVDVSLCEGKIYVIDDYFHVTMLWANEY